MSANIPELLKSENMCVLATSGDDAPLCSLMAYVYDFDRNMLVMATKESSHKLANIRRLPKVSLLVDNRREGLKSGDIGSARSTMWALTVTGTCEIISEGEEFDALTRRIVEEHAHLAGFVSSPGTALLCVTAETYLLLDGVENATFIEVEP